ncbi:unnamed protein product, partial [Prorocentrum cordatum]
HGVAAGAWGPPLVPHGQGGGLDGGPNWGAGPRPRSGFGPMLPGQQGVGAADDHSRHFAAGRTPGAGAPAPGHLVPLPYQQIAPGVGLVASLHYHTPGVGPQGAGQAAGPCG